MTTFLYTLIGATRKQKEKKKVFSLKCIKKSNVIKKRLWVLVFGFFGFGFSWCNGLIKSHLYDVMDGQPMMQEIL